MASPILGGRCLCRFTETGRRLGLTGPAVREYFALIATSPPMAARQSTDLVFHPRSSPCGQMAPGRKGNTVWTLFRRQVTLAAYQGKGQPNPPVYGERSGCLERPITDE